MEQQTGSKQEKEYVKAVYCYPTYLTYMQSKLWETLGWMKHRLKSRLLGEISVTSDMQMTPPLRQKWRGTKEPLGESEDESEKVGLKFNIQKTKIMASGPITSWQIDGETVETVANFIFLSSKITVDGDCSHEIKRHLLLGRKVMTQPRQHIQKQRHYFANKGPSSQGYVFPVVMYGCESWTIKRAEQWRIDAFELWCWRRLLRVPWTARRSNQSIVKEICPDNSLEGLMM